MIHAKLLRNCYLGHIPAGQLHCLTAGMLQLPLIDKMQAQKCHNPIISNHCPHQSLWSSHPHSLPSLTIVPATSIEKETMTVAWLRITLLHSIWCYNAACILSVHVFVHVYLTNVRTKNFCAPNCLLVQSQPIWQNQLWVYSGLFQSIWTKSSSFPLNPLSPDIFQKYIWVILGYANLVCIGGDEVTHSKTRHRITKPLLNTQ